VVHRDQVRGGRAGLVNGRAESVGDDDAAALGPEGDELGADSADHLEGEDVAGERFGGAEPFVGRLELDVTDDGGGRQSGERGAGSGFGVEVAASVARRQLVYGCGFAMMGHAFVRLMISDEDRASHVERAKIVLAVADGHGTAGTARWSEFRVRR
jgi:hypothetical protein